MRRGAALVEVLPSSFCGVWPDRYFKVSVGEPEAELPESGPLFIFD